MFCLIKKMKFQIASDLHLERYDYTRHEPFDVFARLIVPSAPFLLLAGDIASVGTLPALFDYVTRRFERVFYITGNHEYYRHNTTMEHTDSDIAAICSRYENVSFLNNRAFNLVHDQRSVTILGSTLWSAIEQKHALSVALSLSDYSCIYKRDERYDFVYRNISTHDTVTIFMANLRWLKSELRAAQTENRQVIVLTHHMPSFSLIDERYRNESFESTNCAFASPLDFLMERYSNIALWVCGHTHSSADQTIGATRCVINPAGYLRGSISDSLALENSDYCADKVVSLG